MVHIGLNELQRHLFHILPRRLLHARFQPGNILSRQSFILRGQLPRLRQQTSHRIIRLERLAHT